MATGFLAVCALLSGVAIASSADAPPTGKVGADEPPLLLWRQDMVRQGLGREVIESQGTVAIDSLRQQIYCGTGEGEVMALAAGDQRVRWRYRHGAPLQGDAALFCREPPCRGGGDSLVIGGKDGTLLALNAASGRRLWRQSLDAEVRARVVSSGPALYVTTARNQLLALAPATGATEWRIDRPPPQGMSVLGHAGALRLGDAVLTAFSDGLAIAADAQDGSILWQRPLSLGNARFRDADATPVAIDRLAAFASLSDGVFGLVPTTGVAAWQQPVADVGHLSASSAHDGLLFAGSADGWVYALRGRTGSVLWRRRLSGGGAVRALEADRRVLLVLSSDGTLHILSQGTGKELAGQSLGGRPGGALAMSEQYAAHMTGQGSLLFWQLAPSAARLGAR